MSRRNLFMYFFIVLLIIFPISLKGQDCTYLNLIQFNSNHPNEIRCWPPDAEIKYDYISNNEPFAEASTEVDEAAASWNDDTRISISSSTSGESIIWITDKGSWTVIPTAAGATDKYFTDDGKYLCGFTIYLNLAYKNSDDWSSSCESNKIDLSSVMRHEFGHVIGLQDMSCTNTVMDGTYDPGECRSAITQVDIDAANYLHDNSAGRLVDFRPMLLNGRVEVVFEIISQGIGRYKLQRKDRDSKSFKDIAGFDYRAETSQGPVNYKYIDERGFSGCKYRLVEEDSYGHLLIHAVEGVIPPFDYNPMPLLSFDPEKVKRELRAWASKYQPENMGNSSQAADWVAIGPQEYLSSGSGGITALAYWHETEDGLSTALVNLQYIEDNWSGDIKEYISHLYNNGTQYVVLVGDANDHELWDDPGVWSVNGWDEIKPDYQSQPGYDIIPADYYHDQASPDASMSYFTPYYASELPKSDVDDDGYPEIVIGRIPAHSADDVLAYTAKAIEYLQDTGDLSDDPWVDEISLWIDSRNMAGNDGEFADSLGMDLLNYIPGDFNSHIIKNEPCPGCLDYAERESLAVNEFDSGRSLIISFGTVANCYRLNDWLDVRNGFTVSKLDDNEIFPFLLAISCEQGAFDETESPNSGRPICERLLFDDSRGPIGIYAPTRGSWQTGNHLMGKLVLEYLYEKGAQSLGHACLAAQRDMLWVHQNYTDLAKSYVFLGDPALFLAGAVEGQISSSEDDINQTPEYAIKTIYPNPFNPNTSIKFSVPKRASVEINIYDVSGKLLRTLFSGMKQKGTYTVTWNGTNSRGQDVSSGVYFCRMKMEGARGISRKLVLLR
ncbi:MAG: T9SS type A sorting domain-containing protein [Candidatus Latescibacteria bacterium]|nr:T9SS type A sorting domain-containing protein [Candidatus Latescibacterota bacterium]